MKRILLSLMTVALISGVGIAATRAFFSDVETSTGNTFTAGGLDLKIDSTCHYASLVCTDGKWVGTSTTRPDLIGKDCSCTWPSKDLVSEKFFNFTDVKPGDEGENTISLTVDNDAWACITISSLVNNENSCTEPEMVAEGGACGIDPGAGELAQNLYFTAWLDTDHDNAWDGSATEPLLFANKSGPASDVLSGRTYTLTDSTTTVPLAAGTTYIGLQWCAGTMTVSEATAPVITCATDMGNNTQTDSVVGDIAFQVEQARNNPNFVCPTTPTPGT